MQNFTQITDCLTMVAAEFGRVAATGLPKKARLIIILLLRLMA